MGPEKAMWGGTRAVEDGVWSLGGVRGYTRWRKLRKL